MGAALLPAMPTGVALMMTSKVVLARASFLMVLDPDWRASFWAGSGVRVGMKNSAAVSRTPKDAARTGLAGELLGGLGCAVEDEDFCALVADAKDRGACGTAGSQDEDLGAAEGEALFERTDDACHVGVEAVQLAVQQPNRVDCANLGRERVGLFEVREDFLLERHGDGDALDGNLVDEFEQVGEPGGLQCKVDGVDGLATEGRVHHDGRERRADGVAGDAVNLGGGVDVVDAVGFEQGTGGDLAGAGLFSGSGGGEGKGAACADAEHAGDDARFAHADTDDVGVVVHALEEADEGDVVEQGLCGGDDLDEVWCEALDAREDVVEVLGGGEVVMTDDEADAGVAEVLQVGLLERLGGLEFEVYKVEAGDGCLGEDFEFGGEVARELAAIRRAPTGGDGSCGGVVSEEVL